MLNACCILLEVRFIVSSQPNGMERVALLKFIRAADADAPQVFVPTSGAVPLAKGIMLPKTVNGQREEGVQLSLS